MPWRGKPVAPTDTLGFQVAEWIETHCTIPDGELQGQPYRLTDEQLEFLANFFRIRSDADPERPRSAFFYRGAQFRRAQKSGKSPFGGAIVLAHAGGPVVFAGRNAAGEPIGRPHPTPWIQIVANSEEQTDNTWSCVYEMALRGALADIPGVDIGKMDINLPGGGKIEPRSASGRSRLGGRITFALFDESHLMTESSGGVLLATTMRRNLAGMGGRWLETTNAYDPSEGSVAQRTAESPADDILIDNRPCPRRPDLRNEAECLELLDIVYGDAWWVDRRRILADARDPATCPTTADAMRYFFNIVEAGVSDLIDAVRWEAATRKGALERGAVIGLGFDGSRSMDTTSLVASRVSDGRWFHIKTWDPAGYPDHRVPRADVDAVLQAAFQSYDVRYLFYDPHLWQTYGDLWAGRWPKRVVEFATNSDSRMDDLVTRFLSVATSSLTHDGNETLRDHVRAAAIAKGARRRPRPEEDPAVISRFLRVVKKRQGHPIDAAVAGMLAEMARGQAIEDGALQPQPKTFATWGGAR